MTNEETVTYTKSCMFCGKEHTIEMPLNASRLWEGYFDHGKFVPGRHIQHAWPESTPEQREKAISGTCDDCWNLHMNTDND